MTALPPQSPAIEFVSRGDAGPAVLFVPGSYSTAAAWRGVWAHLPADWQYAATSLLGCGATTETRRPGNADMPHELAVVRAAAARMGGGPVHLVGHSFGGTVALAAVLDHTFEVASLALFEANPFNLIADNGPLYGAACDLAREFAAALEAGDPDAAGRIIDYWGGTGTFAAMPPKVQDFCRRAARANALDWETCLGFRLDLSEFAALDFPVMLVRGEGAIPAMIAITDALGACLPAARQEVVEEAGRFLVSTHPKICAALLAEHLARTDVAPATDEGRPT
ncbi:alpha/beta hydrolase [Pararhodobacter sp. SW119]|uniref:alpha/beta fold hydrolase n=1 Tax=Pararhodobacter sp. SW119 TaxID=2780075 RepID=UPI001ADFFF24|nr:alpha/beta hydrolase [Pararhodobacter sp. SW119]